MPLDLWASASLSSVLAVTVSVLTIYLKPVSRKVMLPPFIATAILLGTLAILSFDIYPLSNLLVLGVALLGGSLLGKTVWKYRFAFPLIVLAVSVFDILTFVFGPNSPSSGSPSQSESVTLLYLNFTIRFAKGSRFIIGGLDLLILSTAVMFFALREFTSWQVVVFGLASLVLPFLYLLVLPTNGGLPLLPFIAATSVVFWAIGKRRLRTGSGEKTEHKMPRIRMEL
jgi:hypothetical protein